LFIFFLFAFVQITMASQSIKLGVVTKPGSAQNIVAGKFKQLLEQRKNKAQGYFKNFLQDY